MYVPIDINDYITKIANNVAKLPPDQVGQVLKRIYELEFEIDKSKPNRNDESIAVFEHKPIMDRLSGVGYERLMFEYFEHDVLKHTGEKFEEFYSKPFWYTRAMIEQIKKVEAAMKPKGFKFPEEK